LGIKLNTPNLFKKIKIKVIKKGKSIIDLPFLFYLHNNTGNNNFYKLLIMGVNGRL